MSSTNPAPHSPHNTTGRDPIMTDDHFSLRYGNPIEVIHDIKQHEVDTFEPTNTQATGALVEAIEDTLKEQENQKKRTPLTKSNSSFLRDSTICSEFYHNKNGSVTEIDHGKE